jgi:hypothetical protein
MFVRQIFQIVQSFHQRGDFCVIAVLKPHVKQQNQTPKRKRLLHISNFHRRKTFASLLFLRGACLFAHKLLSIDAYCCFSLLMLSRLVRVFISSFSTRPERSFPNTFERLSPQSHCLCSARAGVFKKTVKKLASVREQTTITKIFMTFRSNGLSFSKSVLSFFKLQHQNKTEDYHNRPTKTQ